MPEFWNSLPRFCIRPPPLSPAPHGDKTVELCSYITGRINVTLPRLSCCTWELLNIARIIRSSRGRMFLRVREATASLHRSLPCSFGILPGLRVTSRERERERETFRFSWYNETLSNFRLHTHTYILSLSFFAFPFLFSSLSLYVFLYVFLSLSLARSASYDATYQSFIYFQSDPTDHNSFSC